MKAIENVIIIITCLVEILFNNGENLNEEKAKECFNKLGNLLFIN